MSARHRRSEQPGIWWFPVWAEARKHELFHRNLYWAWLPRGSAEQEGQQ